MSIGRRVCALAVRSRLAASANRVDQPCESAQNSRFSRPPTGSIERKSPKALIFLNDLARLEWKLLLTWRDPSEGKNA